MTIETEKVKKKYNQKEYNKTFMEKHAERLKNKTICSICKGQYSYYNKSKHNKTKRHNKFLVIENNQTDIKE
jgi:hypothetical protein